MTIINSHSTVATVAVDGKAQVEESFEIGVPFFVWSRVPAWLPVAIPLKVRSFEDLEGFVPKAAARAGLDPDKPFPFLVSDSPPYPNPAQVLNEMKVAAAEVR